MPYMRESREYMDACIIQGMCIHLVSGSPVHCCSPGTQLHIGYKVYIPGTQLHIGCIAPARSFVTTAVS